MPRPDLRESHGDRRRRSILATATDVATAEGLEGLSLGRLADEVGMSKSGVAAHFASKEDLQLHAVAAAAEGYEHNVMARGAEPGHARIQAMMEAWIDYIESIPYRGGCFFAATGAEFGARPGAVRDEIAHHTRAWIHALEREIRTAVGLGQFRENCDPRLFGFQLHALVQEANLRRSLLDDAAAFDDARALLASALSDVLVAPNPPGERS